MINLKVGLIVCKKFEIYSTAKFQERIKRRAQYASRAKVLENPSRYAGNYSGTIYKQLQITARTIMVERI